MCTDVAGHSHCRRIAFVSCACRRRVQRQEFKDMFFRLGSTIASAAIAWMAVAISVQATEVVERADLEALIADAGIEGSFVVFDPAADTMIMANRARNLRRQVPASTFKIANSLIALEEQVVRVDEVVPYDGVSRGMKAWKQDMAMKRAMRVSNVLFYRVLARRIGVEKYKWWLGRLDYGNAEVGTDVEMFWLRGPLKVSPKEQVEFLSKFAGSNLPFSAHVLENVKRLLEIDRGSDWRLFAKTGWSNAFEPGIGWWVGWLEKGGKVYPFALSIDINSRQDADKRVPLGRALLKKLDLI